MITTQQRAEIFRLLRRGEFDTYTVTFQFRQIGATAAHIGGRVDAWLDGLTLAEGSALIKKLKELV